jgi:hypothetical protein
MELNVLLKVYIPPRIFKKFLNLRYKHLVLEANLKCGFHCIYKGIFVIECTGTAFQRFFLRKMRQNGIPEPFFPCIGVSNTSPL